MAPIGEDPLYPLDEQFASVAEHLIEPRWSFTHNLFFQAQPEVTALDKAPVVGDPDFTRGTGPHPAAYRLSTTSPALGAGAIRQQARFAGAGQGIFAHVPAIATHDFYHNPLPDKPNIGAYQGPGL